MAAGLRFEAIRGVPHSALETAEISDAGLAAADPDTLASSIWNWLDGPGADSDSRGSAYWAIGKRYCPKDVEPLIAALIHELSRDIDVVYQIMIALANLGEPVFPPHQREHSSRDSENNRAAAERYLNRQQ